MNAFFLEITILLIPYAFSYHFAFTDEISLDWYLVRFDTSEKRVRITVVLGSFWNESVYCS